MGLDAPRWPLPDAFGPHPDNDTDGLSVYREKYHTPAEVAAFRTKGTKPTWIARLSAKSIADMGLSLTPDPRDPDHGLPARAGHALIVEMNSRTRKSDDVQQWKQQLVAAIVSVEGGAMGFAAPTAPTSMSQS